AQAPAWATIQGASDGRLAWKPWAQSMKKDAKTGNPVAYPERDNRGMIHLYFTPHDRTVALLNTQGIGWQGVPDRYTAEWSAYPDEARLPVAFQNQGWSQPEKRSLTWHHLMDDLHADGFRQRVFMSRIRDGKPFQVGLPPQHVSLREDHDDDPAWWTSIKGLDKTLPPHAMRRINAAPLHPPIDFAPGPEALPISPIDAAIALTNEATNTVQDSFDDPRPVGNRPPICPPLIIPPGHWDKLREMLNRGKPVERQIGKVHWADDILDEQKKETGRLWVCYDESPDETRSRLQRTGSTENSFHSAIVSNHWHSQAVTAYDLAVSSTIWWSKSEKDFYDYLCEVADWRIKVPNPDNLKQMPQAASKISCLRRFVFYKDEGLKNKTLIEATAWYYAKGDLPIQIDQAETADQMSSWIHFETTGHRSPIA
ncbi:MAG TPA: DUF3274 domain-containing protein, partial [Holophaga sp.]|nr:DUF3274 domain-containing protein [Holophaga sp.]